MSDEIAFNNVLYVRTNDESIAEWSVIWSRSR